MADSIATRNPSPCNFVDLERMPHSFSKPLAAKVGDSKVLPFLDVLLLAQGLRQSKTLCFSGTHAAQVILSSAASSGYLDDDDERSPLSNAVNGLPPTINAPNAYKVVMEGTIKEKRAVKPCGVAMWFQDTDQDLFRSNHNATIE
ncbi:unnamed protein product [Cylicocyclus nassatus]|uniref:Uncharacterized protein n=1 Tax=Cylicocyclus nassatus TaxID=53992 RepID=A0AA36HDC8_CYLNA|nr:unnamed protein product [Cylicocyclus nassatus]